MLTGGCAIRLAGDGHVRFALGGGRGHQRARTRDQHARRAGAAAAATPRDATAARSLAMRDWWFLPLLLWEDYLLLDLPVHDLRREPTAADAAGQRSGVRDRGLSCASLRTPGAWTTAGLQACLVLALAVQALSGRPLEGRQRGGGFGAGYAPLMLRDRSTCCGTPSTGAMTRVVLPMTVGVQRAALRRSTRRVLAVHPRQLCT